MTRRAPRAAAAAFLACAAGARASPAAVLGFDRPADAFAPSPGFHLDDSPPGPPPAPAPIPPEAVSASHPVKPPFWDAKTTAITAGVLVGVPILGYFTWWRVDSRPTFTTANEGWFQHDTYAGGADKASHVFLGYLGTQILQSAYRSAGKTPAESRALAIGVVAAAGVLVELGDGYSKYGFAWEDIAANTVGSLLATGIDVWKIDDTVGLRYGRVKVLIPDACCRYGGYGADYSKEIYSADLKLAGFLPRLGAKAGPARFLLLSVTYGTKGYRYSDEPLRQRNVGLEIGLNVREILVAVGVPENPWWGKILLGLASYIRIPYTSFGWHYDLNHGTWSGPDTGNKFDPGSIIYD